MPVSTDKKKPLYFLEGNHVFISIDRSIVDELGLTDNDTFTEEVTDDGILLRRRK